MVVRIYLHLIPAFKRDGEDRDTPPSRRGWGSGETARYPKGSKYVWVEYHLSPPVSSWSGVNRDGRKRGVMF